MPQNNITARPRGSRTLANPVGRSLGSLAKKVRHSKAPVSGAHFWCKSPTKPVSSPGVGKGVRPPGLAADTCILMSLFD